MDAGVKLTKKAQPRPVVEDNVLIGNLTTASTFTVPDDAIVRRQP